MPFADAPQKEAWDKGWNKDEIQKSNCGRACRNDGCYRCRGWKYGVRLQH